jgi:hypothetical protein
LDFELLISFSSLEIFLSEFMANITKPVNTMATTSTTTYILPSLRMASAISTAVPPAFCAINIAGMVWNINANM